jgi:purine-nucleoside phosphorylase
MGDKEGFSLEESTWIALLASVLNVQAVLVALSGVRVNETTNPIVSDIVNFTDDTRPLHYVQHLHLHKNTAGRSLLSGDGISYLACEGPSRPSSVEKHVAKEVGADAIGTTSVSLLYLLGYFGIATSAYLNESDVDVQTLLQKVDAVTPVAVNTNVDATLTGVTRGNHLVYEQVIEASEYVKKHMDGKTAKTGIIDFNLNLPLLQDSRVQVVSEISLESIPHCPIRTLKGGAKLQLVNINASSSTPSLVYVVNNLGHAYESFETNCATFVIRLFQELQVKNVYMTSSFLRTHGENQVPKDAVIALSEHFNFTGENPLIGHNENRWGDRFFDMSFVYSNEKLLPPLSHTSEQRLVAVRCLFTNNVRGLHSNTLVNNAAKTFNTQVIGDVGLFEAATVRHTVGKLDCVMLGVAFDPYDFVAQATPSESQYKQLVDVLVAQTVIEN